MSVISLPLSVSSYVRSDGFTLRRNETGIETLAGVTQITSFPDRRWLTTINLKPLLGTAIRDWNLFAMQLTSLANSFAYSPPYYSGPTTSYAGASPLVMGAGQTGTSLVVDGLSNSVPILKAGDFLSFDVTTGLGNTNRQLNAVTADVSSNGSGQATFALLIPIRQSPADDAAVNITTPSALFRFTKPEALVQMDVENAGTIAFDAIELILP